jgi:glucose/arabinose dehydrogenase
MRRRPVRLALAALVVAPLLLPACGGGGGGGGGPGAPANLDYVVNPAFFRVGTAAVPLTPTWTGGDPPAFDVSPALPAGLSLDTASGVVSGTPTASAASADYLVTASNAAGSSQTLLTVAVGAALPAAFATLAAGYDAEVVLSGLAKPVRMAEAPDGRVFFNELDTGDTRILLADGTLQTAPFVHNDVLTGNHRGLLGLALHPDFAANGWVYLAPCTPTDGMLPDRVQVLRYTDAAGAATNETPIVPQLPIAQEDNGGSLCFGPGNRLFVSVGDTQDPALSQQDGSLSGRILRYTDTGGIPSDNPDPASPEWCRGMRNTFALAVQPTTGDLFGGDNGAAVDDHLDYLLAGKNFGWGGLPPNWPPGDVGIEVRTWADVITLTSVCWHTGAGWGPAFANNLFVTSYSDASIRRLQLSGAQFLNLDFEDVIATFRFQGIDNIPLDAFVASDGSLWVSTFTAIYRITRP